MTIKDKIKKLEVERGEIQKQLNEITEKQENEVQLPRCRKMIGWCIKSTYSDNRFAKVLEFIENKNGYFHFIMEEFSVNEAGLASIRLIEHYPYLNKEWWDIEFPVYGYERISEEEYQIKKAEMYSEMASRNKLRKWLLT